MLQIITKIPLFIWPLFIVLLLGGLKARKGGTVPLLILLLIPALFFIWYLFSFFGTYGTGASSVLCWFLCLGVGFLIGFLHIQQLKLRFNKQKKTVEMPGSWIPLILSMSIFFSKFSIGMMGALFPHLNGSILFLSLELFCASLLGVFAGRGIGCLQRYRKI